MPHSTAVKIACGGLLCLALGCKKARDLAPEVPTSGGQSVTVTRAMHDASTPDTKPLPEAGLDDDGGGLFPRPIECRNVPLADASGESPTTLRYVDAVDEPPDFPVTRAVATWEITCARPTIRISLSDGHCPDGNGHQLDFLFDAVSINGGFISPGQNAIESDDSSHVLGVRYTRPRGLVPSGVWGTCGDAPSGGVTIRDPRIGTGVGAHFEALFQMVLPPCDGSDNAAEQVSGSFDLELRRSLEEACPSG